MEEIKVNKEDWNKLKEYVEKERKKYQNLYSARTFAYLDIRNKMRKLENREEINWDGENY